MKNKKCDEQRKHEKEQEELQTQSKQKKREIYIITLLQKYKEKNKIVNVNCTYIKGRCVRADVVQLSEQQTRMVKRGCFGAPKQEREREIEREKCTIDKRTRTTKAVSERV